MYEGAQGPEYDCLVISSWVGLNVTHVANFIITSDSFEGKCFSITRVSQRLLSLGSD